MITRIESTHESVPFKHSVVRLHIRHQMLNIVCAGGIWGNNHIWTNGLVILCVKALHTFRGHKLYVCKCNNDHHEIRGKLHILCLYSGKSVSESYLVLTPVYNSVITPDVNVSDQPDHISKQKECSDKRPEILSGANSNCNKWPDTWEAGEGQ